jgi:dGTPase
MEHLATACPLHAELIDQIDTQFPGASARVRFWEVQRQVINHLVGGLIKGTVAAAEAAGVETVDDVRALGYRLVRLTPEAATVNDQLRSLLVNHVYSYAQLVEDRSAAVARIRELFEFLLEYPDRVSAGYRERLHEMPVHRVVCDYVAGMTDAFLVRVHRELLG